MLRLKLLIKKTGKEVGTKVEIKTISPSQKNASTTMIKCHNHFGYGLSLDEKGKYQITAIATLKDKKTAKFYLPMR